MLILIGRWVPLALTVIAPVVIDIFLYHLFLVPGNMVLSVVLLILGIYLARGHEER